MTKHWWFKAKDPTNQTLKEDAFLLEGNGFWNLNYIHHSFSDIWIHQFVGICFFYLVRNVLKHNDVFVIIFFEKLILIDSKSLAFDVYSKAEQKYWKSIIRNPPNHVNFIPLHGCVYTSVFLSWNYTIVAWKFMSCSFPKLFHKRWKQATTKLLFKKTNFASKTKPRPLLTNVNKKHVMHFNMKVESPQICSFELMVLFI